MKIEELKTELREDIFGIVRIYIMAKDCYQYSYELYNPKYLVERNYIQGNLQIQTLRQYLWRTCLTEVAKIVSEKKNDHYRIKSILENLKVNGKYEALNFDYKIIEELETKMTENQGPINNIIKLRDKAYAHSDKDMDTVLRGIKLSFSEVNTVLQIVEILIRSIYSIIFESTIILDSPGYESRGEFKLLEKLAFKKGYYNEEEEEIAKDMLNFDLY